MAILAWVLDASVLVFAVSSMLSVGLGNTLAEILGPLRDLRAVVRALVANFVLVPLLAVLVLRLVPLDVPHAVGILLIATAAGAPFLIKLVEAAESDIALSATVLVLLLPVTIIYMPVVVPLIVPGASINALSIAVPLVLSMLLPLAVGLLVRHHREGWARRYQPEVGTLSTVALVVLVVITVLTNLGSIATVIFTEAVLAVLLVIGGAFLIGYGVGSGRRSREVLGLGTAQRNIAAATVVATQAVGHPDTLVMVIVSSLAGLAILFPIAVWLRNRRGRTT